MNERHVWLADQRINNRGVALDVPLVKRMVAVVDAARQQLDAQMRAATSGHVSRCSNAAELAGWVRAQGVDIAGVAKADVSDLLDTTDCPEHVRAALVLRQEAARSSVAKLDKMLDVMCDDGRVRGLMQYHGASTGRWAGRLIQVQNLPRPMLEEAELADCIDIINSHPAKEAAEVLDVCYGPPLGVVSSLLRSMFVAAPGKRLLAGDFAAVEGRGLAWHAGEQWALDVYANDGKMYERNAASIYGVPVDKVSKQQRFVGKVAELALGYQGGVKAFQSMARMYRVDIDEETAETAKVAWRDDRPRIVALWHDTERAAIDAVQQSGKVFTSGAAGRECRWRVNGSFLWCRLPSGRLLCYPYPEVRDVATPWGQMKPQLSYMGVNGYTRKWERISSYGGKLCLSGETLVLTDAGWKPLSSVARDDLVWDGDAFASHDGVAMNGVRKTVSVDGVRMTLDHEVLTDEGWVHASQSEGHHRAAVRLPDGVAVRWVRWPEEPVDFRMLGLRGRDGRSCDGHREMDPARGEGILRVHETKDHLREARISRDVAPPRVCCVGQHAGEVSTREPRLLEELRRAGDHGMPTVGHLRHVLGGHGPDLRSRTDAGPDRQRQGVLAGELPVGNVDDTGPEPEECYHPGHALREFEHSGVGRAHGFVEVHAVLPTQGGKARFGPVGPGREYEPVYDIVNCGAGHRFVVHGDTGPLVVHNCENVTQALCRDLLADRLVEVEFNYDGVDPVFHVHDEIVCETDSDRYDGTWFEQFLCVVPQWAGGFPIGAECWTGRRYRK